MATSRSTGATILCLPSELLQMITDDDIVSQACLKSSHPILWTKIPFKATSTTPCTRYLTRGLLGVWGIKHPARVSCILCSTYDINWKLYNDVPPCVECLLEWRENTRPTPIAGFAEDEGVAEYNRVSFHYNRAVKHGRCCYQCYHEAKVLWEGKSLDLNRLLSKFCALGLGGGTVSRYGGRPHCLRVSAMSFGVFMEEPEEGKKLRLTAWRKRKLKKLGVRVI